MFNAFQNYPNQKQLITSGNIPIVDSFVFFEYTVGLADCVVRISKDGYIHRSETTDFSWRVYPRKV